ncbi:PAS domain-containing protein [Accumulibacter sp.]|uniref:PAS domain-containing protein n=1 Tax=Accumulibacter sp. TaxID=2053492 RepID=UPI0025CB8452|nr:PAS domain-containing protein [Accumulibacter sp.]MCM8611426.1 PAS domain-containing protein [Accumulibacter sp.]MCM8634927.1 PAS domain-containing protein [Accumulibacter sp.]MCM8638554.1 PAS domain-containing protein [Accumulibacter sp.]
MSDGRDTQRSALVVALVYAVTGCLWILFSDKVVEWLFSDPDAIIRASMLKGWFYVAATSLLLFFLVEHYLGALHASLRREVDNLLERQRTHELLAAITEHSEDAIFAKDLQGRYRLFNPAASRFLGKPTGEVLGRDERDFFPLEQAAMLREIAARIIASGSIETSEETLDTALGQRTFLATRGPLRDAGQQIIGTFGISRDITASKEARDALLESAVRLRLLVEHSPAALAMFDREMRYLAASNRWLKDFALPAGGIIGRSHYEVFPEIGEDLKELHRRGLAGETLGHEADRFERADGSVLWLRWELRPWLLPDGKIGGIVIFSEDISRRREAERARQQLADDLGATLRAIPDLLFELDADGRYLKVMASHEAHLAAPVDQLLGRTVTDVLPPDAAATMLAALAAASRNGSDYGRTIMLPLAAGPSHFEISVARKPMVSGQGERFIVLSRDITARKLAEDQLRQRNAELERFNRATIGRELDMLEMKKTINALSRELSREPPYPLAFLPDEDGAPEGRR